MHDRTELCHSPLDWPMSYTYFSDTGDGGLQELITPCLSQMIIPCLAIQLGQVAKRLTEDKVTQHMICDHKFRISKMLESVSPDSILSLISTKMQLVTLWDQASFLDSSSMPFLVCTVLCFISLIFTAIQLSSFSYITVTHKHTIVFVNPRIWILSSKQPGCLSCQGPNSQVSLLTLPPRPTQPGRHSEHHYLTPGLLALTESSQAQGTGHELACKTWVSNRKAHLF